MTPASSCTSDGTVTGPFTSSLSGLAPNTTYYVRAFATNVAGTAYGSSVTFTTSGAYTLTVNKTGTGDGTITPDTGTLAWFGNIGTANHDQGATVTLSASANPDSYFSGWRGLCNGNGSSCAVQMSQNESATATFSLNTSFSGSPTDGYNPFYATFTDTSAGNPTSWSWDFGDGSTSKLQNPVHRYESPGSYNVSLTATGPGWTATMTKNSYITVSTCNAAGSVMIADTNYYYSSIQNAFNMSGNGETLLIQGTDFVESPNLTQAISLRLSGGYSCDYSMNPGFTTILGTLTISESTVTIENFIIQ